jgi:CRISPR-associated endonuclease/helicase Cas3
MFKNLAKPDETIIEHTKACLDVAEELYSAYTIEVEELLRSERHDGKEIFFLAVMLHDFGKYAAPFQEITLGSNQAFWKYRHEILSSEFVGLFKNLEKRDKRLIIYAILSHHNKTISQLEKAIFKEDILPLFVGIPTSVQDSMLSARKEAYNEGKSSIIKYSEEIFDELKKIINFSKLNLSIDYDIEKLINVFDEIEIYYQKIDKDNELPVNMNKLIFFKGLLVTSDHLASAHEKILTIDQDIEEYYLSLFSIPTKNHFRTTQIKCIESEGDSSILRAPTGTGKTEAAFLWANENLKKNRYARFFYVLPYTASINAMFERLNGKGFAEKKVELLHGKNRAYYYSLSIKDKTDSEIEERIDEINKEISFKKQNAKNFVKPVKVVTPHQIIKYFYGLKHFEEAFLQYRNALFIVDEIHCYDRIFLSELFAVMKYIKEEFNGSFLFMSATLPSVIEEIIRNYIGINNKTIQFNQSELEKFTKTKLVLIGGLIEDENNITTIQNDINKGLRVLVVCNTIKKAQSVFRRLESKNKVLIHSAFNFFDRNKIENQIIKHEKSMDKIQVLVGTQAIEVSLDLDYDCCYTEIASIDSLIQRFGRVYRNRKKKYNEYGNVYVFTKADEATNLIYNEIIEGENYQIISLTLECLERLNERPLDYSAICSNVDSVYGKLYQNSILKVFHERYYRLQNISLKPMNDYSTEAEQYFEQFDGIKVLPSSLSNKYESYICAQRFVDADNLLVNLSERKLFNYYRKNYVFRMQVKGKNIFLADESILGYSQQIGLYLKNEPKYNFI